MREIEVRGLAYIPLGRQGENGAQKVVWPGIADSWARLYGNGVFALAVLRQGDSAPYPASITSENGDIVWVLSSADTAKPGEGMAELTYTVCGVIARSRTWRTVVERSLSADGTSEPPEAYQSWVDEVLTAAAGVETAVNKMPYIDTDTGNWFKWDAKSNAFADTGVSAQGPKGDTGPAGASGAKGDPGPKGDPGEKGEKGDTGATGAAGAKGETGATGPAGANGRDGAPGPKGETGPAGPKGDPGEKGEKGDTGATGPQGEPGPAGKDGITPEIVEGELVTVPSAGGGADPSLGITGAQVGQIAKITAVDTDGKPTAWEAVDMAGGGGETWEKIAEIVIPEGADEATALTINKDFDGNPFSLVKARLCAKFPKYTGVATIPNFSFAMLNGKTGGRVTPLAYTSAWPKVSMSIVTGTVYEIDVSSGQQIEHVVKSGNAGWSDDSDRDYVVYGGAASVSTTWYADTLWAKPITSVGGTNMLIYPGCRFVLYGVRA